MILGITLKSKSLLRNPFKNGLYSSFVSFELALRKSGIELPCFEPIEKVFVLKRSIIQNTTHDYRRKLWKNIKNFRLLVCLTSRYLCCTSESLFEVATIWLINQCRRDLLWHFFERQTWTGYGNLISICSLIVFLKSKRHFKLLHWKKILERAQFQWLFKPP